MLLGLTLLVLFLLVLGGPILAQYQLRARQAFWSSELEKVSPGASRTKAVGLFRSHGILLDCRPYISGQQVCSGRDTEAYGLLPEWRIHFELKFQSDQLVESKQQALGLGL